MKKPKGKTKKQPKGPRPVTAWFAVNSGAIDTFWGACPSAREAKEDLDPGESSVRCRVVPIRKPTEKELGRLAQKLYDSAYDRHAIREDWDDVARLAWKLGAR